MKTRMAICSVAALAFMGTGCGEKQEGKTIGGWQTELKNQDDVPLCTVREAADPPCSRERQLVDVQLRSERNSRVRYSSDMTRFWV
jgi:hypothetical protein